MPIYNIPNLQQSNNHTQKLKNPSFGLEISFELQSEMLRFANSNPSKKITQNKVQQHINSLSKAISDNFILYYDFTRKAGSRKQEFVQKFDLYEIGHFQRNQKTVSEKAVTLGSGTLPKDKFEMFMALKPAKLQEISRKLQTRSSVEEICQ